LRAPAAVLFALILTAASMLSALGGAQAKHRRNGVGEFAGPLALAPAPRSAPASLAALQDLAQPSQPSELAAPAISAGFSVLGSMEYKVTKHNFSQEWQSVRRRIEGERALYDYCANAKSDLCPKKISQWRSKLAALKGQDKLQQLKELNRFVNHLVSYADDKTAFGKSDHWSNPAELLQTSGDCEDYAILKFFSLLELGFSNEQLRLAIVRDSKRRVLHAVVSAELDGKTYILDSLFDRPVSHQYILKYVPIYSWNLQDHWAHIVTKKIRIEFVESFDKVA